MLADHRDGFKVEGIVSCVIGSTIWHSRSLAAISKRSIRAA